MKAIIATRSGPPEVLQLKDIEKPAPKPDEVLIKVHAATVTRGDVILRKMHPLLFLPLRLFGMVRKETPGHEFAGEIEAVGTQVTRFKPGDQVFGTTTGLRAGANAEYLCLPQEWKRGVLAFKPANLPYDEAAPLPVGGMTALEILRKGNLQPGAQVLVYGASGSVGTYAVQLARAFGAQVTGICSTSNVELVKSLGAEQVIDYTQEDFIQNGERYDVIFDAVGKLSAEKCKSSLKENGAFLTVNTSTSEKIENLLTIKELAEAGKLRAVIDRRYPLEQTADAHRYVESGRKKGNVVITT